MKNVCLRVAFLLFAMTSPQWAQANSPHCDPMCRVVPCPEAANVHCIDEELNPVTCEYSGICFPVEYS
jgi:hypothetical protein